MTDTFDDAARSQLIQVRSGAVTLVGERWSAEGDSRGDVLLLHGGAQRRHSWRRTAERLARQGWTAHAFDARGHGDSSWAADGDYSMEASVGDLVAIAATLESRPVLVGASMGGMTSLLAVGGNPELARALVMVDIVARPNLSGTSRIRDFMASAPNGFASLEEAADAISAYNPHRPRPASLEGLKKNLRLFEDGRWHWHWDPSMLIGMQSRSADRMMADDENPLILAARKVTIPTLLVRGGDSDVVSEAGFREMQELIPQARAVQVPQAGHMIAGDDNDVFTAELGTFLSELPAE